MRKCYESESKQAVVPSAQKDPDEICCLRKAVNQIEPLQKEAQAAHRACIKSLFDAEEALKEASIMNAAAAAVEGAATDHLINLSKLLEDALNDRSKKTTSSEQGTNHRPEEGYSHE